MNKWIKGLPENEGVYWLYSYRYGKESLHGDNKPELQLATVHKIANGTMTTADGQHVFESEIECPHYTLALLPELPDIDY